MPVGMPYWPLKGQKISVDTDLSKAYNTPWQSCFPDLVIIPYLIHFTCKREQMGMNCHKFCAHVFFKQYNKGEIIQ